MAAPRPAAPPGAFPRNVLFAALCAACLLIAGGYAALAVARDRPAAPALAAGPASLAGLGGESGVLFLETDGGPRRQLSLAPLAPAEAEPRVADMLCQRVHIAAGQGLCVGGDLVHGGALLFDADLKIQHTLPTSGIPSRARVSPDGRLAAMTHFVRGHSYGEGGFSTQTTLIDTAAGRAIADLEEFAVLRDGAPFRSPDFNFWGVTFARDPNRFYATLGTGGTTYLLEGDVAARQLRVMRENVECPSLSPDNTRLVFKSRVPGGRWRLHLLDLAALTDQPLGETRSVDDQVEWLDDGHVLYALRDEGPPPTIRPDLWLLPVDGGAPQLFLKGAMSPAAIR
ncbi:MAG TPA: TolB-like translocation protein [Chloroflexota bacterium]|nr:TolB-like translocation protein [Chloroflexota bacterium]